MQAEGLEGSARSTHSFARVSVAGQVQLTGVRWATLRPSWAEEGLVFRDVPAAAELVAELWDVGGAPTRTKKLREQRVRARRPPLSGCLGLARSLGWAPESSFMRSTALIWHSLGLA